MKIHPRKLLGLLIIVFIIPYKVLAVALTNCIPYLIEIAKQALLSLALITGYLVNTKPEFPSQADSIEHQGIKNTYLNQFLQDIAKQTGVIITPETLNQLSNAGIHHDYQKLESLLATLQPTDKNLSSSAGTFSLQKSEINPYALARGIKRFEQPGAYTQITNGSIPDYNSTITRVQTSSTASKNTADPVLTDIHSLQYSNFGEYSNELSIPNPANPTLVLHGNHQSPQKNQSAARYMHQLMHQQAVYSQGKAFHEWERAFFSVAAHFHNSTLRQQLKKHVQSYHKVLHDACQLGASAQAIQAQTQIALQGLPLPGFLHEFSEVLQEKASRICFKHNGTWKGIETSTQLEELKQVCQAYQTLLDKLSWHLEWENSTDAQDCIEELYLLDQGRGNWAGRFFSWMGNFFDSEAISLQEFQSRIATNSFNKQTFTALELLENKEFKLARLPLEHMAHSAKTVNEVLLHQALLKQYQEKIAFHYGNTNIPLKYQDDPVFWMYKPTTEHMQFDDPALRSIENHLIIRDTIYNEILNTICKKQPPTPFIRNLAYTLIDKLNDPIALINHLEFLSSDSQNPEIQQACNAFYDKGVLTLFGLTKQASASRVPVSDLLNRSEYAHIRNALNKLLLVDARSEQSKRSLQLVFDCIPHACTDTTFSKDYQNIIKAITQAHIDAKAPKEILHISCFPINPTKDLHITLLKAMSKAAQEDLGKANPAANSPLTTREAWACIQKVQELENSGETAEANALANTYLKGYLDEKMPTQKYIKPIIITAATAGIWFANSQEQPKQTPKISPQFSVNSPDPDDEESEEIKKYRSILKEILKDAIQGNKTRGKSKIYEKLGGFKKAVKDFLRLNPTEIKDIPTGKTGKLPDENHVNVRTKSDDGRPTLEIINLINKNRIKIRYN
ncbi:MAG: hypothetical protein AMXMBFR12_00340 [Candidatus Babeliales bacterium]